jgi:ABC-type polysaccharide/polyol phosphate export permease
MGQFLIAIREALKIAPVWLFMAYHDVLARYRRTTLGPWWITIGTGIGLAGMALVWSTLFGMALRDIFPYMTIGFTLWGFIASTLVEGAAAFSGAGTLKMIRTPLLTFVFFSVLKTLYTFLHNCVLIIIVLIIFQVDFSLTTLLFIPGLLLLILTSLLVTVILGIVGARFRDLSYIISSFLSFLMLLTPVMWNASMFSGKRIFLIYLNPIAYYLEIIRAPLLNKVPDVIYYYGVLGTIIILLVLANYLYNRFAKRIIFWL